MNKALVVGINTYEKQTALNGCLNDIADVTASLIERAAVKPADVVELADANATKKRILDELAGLVAALGSGDCGYFHVSGHGVRMRANDPQEPDGMDEAICPYEFDWTDDTAIRDNEVLEILAGLRLDARMVLVFDSCHSGDMSRFVAVPNSRPRTLPPPTGAYGTRGPTRNGFRAASRAPNIAFVSAVSPWQLAADTAFDGRSNGAFTYYFLRQANASAPGTSLTALVTAIEPELRPFEMTPVAEGGDAPFYQPVTTKRALPRSISLVRPVTLARVGAVVFDQAYHASLLGQELAVSVRISVSNGELVASVTARMMSETLVSPPMRISGNMSFPIALGFFGMQLVFSVSDWQYGPQSVQFVLGLDIRSRLPFVPSVRIARAPVSVDLAVRSRALATSQVTSPADLVALLTLQHMSRDASAQPRDDAPVVRGYREPWIQVLDSGMAGWGPSWREDRVIRPFTNRPRPDGVRRHSVDIGPQRGAGNVYVVGWLSDQETDFDFILHMGNGFFGGWGEIDWRVQGYYADIAPFPRDVSRGTAASRKASNGEARRFSAPTHDGEHGERQAGSDS